jgi:hypothetical protein
MSALGAVDCGHKALFIAHNQLMRVKKIDTVKVDVDAQFEVGKCFSIEEIASWGGQYTSI